MLFRSQNWIENKLVNVTGCCALLAKSSLFSVGLSEKTFALRRSPTSTLSHRISFCLFAKKRFLALVYPIWLAMVVILALRVH